MDGIFKLSVASLLAVSLTTAGFAAESLSSAADGELAAGHFQAACKLYRVVLATHRSDVPTLLKAAKAYEGAGDLDEAIVKARTATTLEPNNAEAHLILAHCLDMNRDERAAILQFEVVLELKSAITETRKAAYGPLLRLLKHENEMVKLLKAAREGAHDFPQDPDSHYNLAWALSQMPNTNPKQDTKVRREAISEYHKCIALGEKQSNAHYNLAVLLCDSGEKVAAKEELETFLKLAPEAAETTGAKELSAKLSN
jgi:tetratricopeptide (TPR) repeat protein